MARHGCSPDGAFALLSRESQDSDATLREVAADIVRRTRR